MTNLKTKRKWLAAVAALCMFIALMVGIGGISTSTAYAATTKLYTATFDYNYYRGVYISTATVAAGSGTDVTKTEKITVSEDTSAEVSFQVYGSATSGTATLSNGGYINSSTVKIKIINPFDSSSFVVANSAGTSVSGSLNSNVYTVSGLSDGKYEVTYTGGSEWKEETSIRDHPRAVKLVATFSFTVDCTVPTVSGAASTSTGKYVNSAFTVSASDGGSGVSGIYWKDPMASAYSFLSSASKTVTANGTNGLYRFYAVDKMGNTSSVYYACLDTVKPTGTLYAGANTITSGSSTTEDYIKFVASDSLSGVKTVYVKTPNSSGYVTCTSGSQYSSKGSYSFYCVDNAGNTSSTYTVTLNEAHTHAYVSSVTSPTCTSGGYTTYTCSCGNTYTTNNTSATGHTYSDWTTVTAATCTAKGSEKRYCIKCGLVGTREVAATGHSYKSSVTSATCTSQGYTTYTCTNCGASYISSLTAMTGHSYVTTEVEATCTDGGYTLHKCTRCGDEYKTDETAATGHTYIEQSLQATCTQGGYVLHQCTKCGYEYKSDEVAALGHEYETAVTTAATCTASGERYHKCSRCGDEYTTEIPASGHSYSLASETNENGKVIRVYSCDMCGESYTENLGDQYAKVTNYVEYLFEQYAPYMWWVLLATAGVWSIVIGVFFAIAQKNDEKEKARKMIVNYVIGLVVIAVIVVACPYLVRGIASLVT